jgi:hypothetical protein
MVVRSFFLIVAMGVAAITLIAMGTIIAKAGYSAKWILVPLSPVILVIAMYVDLNIFVKDSLQNGFFAVSDLKSAVILFYLSIIAYVVAWVFFLIFAFRPWPSLEGAAAGGPRPTVVPAVAGRAGAPGAGQTRTTTWSALAAPTVASRGAVDTRRRIYCAWCGERIPGNRALGHDCGPKDRPEVICRFCGQAFPEGTTLCPTCDA